MIKLMLSGRVTPSRPRQEAMSHLKSVHGPLVYDAPASAGAMPALYVQNHVDQGLDLPPSLTAWAWDRDLVTEISFEDLAHLRAATQTPYYLDVLKPDEARFVDHASVRPLVVEEHRQGVVVGDTAWKVFVYLKAAGDRAAFEKGWSRAREAVASRCMAQAANLPRTDPGAPPAFVDGVWSLWFADRDEASAFVNSALPLALESFEDHLRTDAGFVVLAQELPVSRLRRENDADARRAPQRPSGRAC